MIQFICYFFPAFISLLIRNKQAQNKLKLTDLILHYPLYVICINLFVYFYLYLFTELRYYYLTIGHFNISFVIQYLILGSVFAIVFPVFLSFFRKNIQVDVDVEEKHYEED